MFVSCTDEIGDEATVGQSAGGVLEVGLSIRRGSGHVATAASSAGSGVHVLVVAGVEEGVTEHEQSVVLLGIASGWAEEECPQERCSVENAGAAPPCHVCRRGMAAAGGLSECVRVSLYSLHGSWSLSVLGPVFLQGSFLFFISFSPPSKARNTNFTPFCPGSPVEWGRRGVRNSPLPDKGIHGGF